MRKFTKPRINTFFVEIIIVILFFSIVATIIVQVFATTNYDLQVSKIKSKAVANATSMASLYENDQNIEESLKKMFGNDVVIKTDDNGRYVVELDKNLECGKDDKQITLDIIESISEKKAGEMKKITMKYSYFDDEIYKIEAESYVPGE